MIELVLLTTACALAAFGLTNLVVSVFVATVWRLRAAAWTGRSSRWLFVFRAFPAAFSAAFVLLALVPSFLRHEPRGSIEGVGPWLAVAAGAGAAILLAGLARALVAWLETQRVVRAWRRSARPLSIDGWKGEAYSVELGGPGVFVIGYRRPTLFVARNVESACTRAELEAIVAHEAAHVSARDNLKRLVLRGLPDLLGPFAVAVEVERAWCDAAEDEADRAAAGTADGAALDLASAIVKVARLACSPAMPAAAGALLGGGPITRRVLRLSGAWPATPPAGARCAMPWIAALGLPLLVPLHPALSERLHAVVEAVVEALGRL